ncbi:ABC transporter ATP-binding protein [Sphingobium nicotianae]|uniref:ABC transporter ATP-binding protein/permease n=1 Tax=Sphingobium nicotianae TaxID=2782607 RepID=A0A9X1ISE3_9SPHN|nr:ABC transporter ATP-binding protein [Sphingobium nicotianae]MBT2188234.1 ABC transporter ATP-binding protein/permease [Sphingobium nicotianae]
MSQTDLTDPLTVKIAPHILRRLAKLGFEHPWRMGLAAVSILAASFFGLMIPKLLGAGVDQASELLKAGASHAGEARMALLRTGALILGAGLMRGLLTASFGYNSETVSQQVGAKLRRAYFAKLQELSFEFHDRIHSGDLITRGMLDLEGARQFIDQGMLRVLMLTLMITASIVMLLTTDFYMGLLALSFVPYAAWRATTMGANFRRVWLVLQQRMSNLTRTMEENLQGIRVVRAFASHDYELQKFDEMATETLRAQRMRIKTFVTAMTMITLAYYTSLGLVLLIGSRHVQAGTMTVGRLTEFLAYMTVLVGPLRMTGMVMNSWARASSCGARLFEILDLEPRIKDKAGAHPLVISGGASLKFDHVTFGYVPGKPVLHDISFEVKPGQTLGVVGPPGSGKTTIANLIPRFYDVDRGAVSIAGQDVRDVTLESLRRIVGVVQQEAFLFDASVTSNVSYSDPLAEEERVIEAATTAHIHDYVTGLPMGYDSKLGERGVSLSGGQRQRMSIARGVVPGPGVMVFDDSTAAIDAATEQRLRRALQAATRDKATVIIAQRLGSLMHADEIIVLDKGCIVERGTHPQLVKTGGMYARLFELQSRSGAETDENARGDVA